MLSRVLTIALVGLNGYRVGVEVDIAPGLYHFDIVGLAAKSVQESKERVAAAIKNSGFEMPRRRITVNLSPADLQKNGPSYDFPIAAGILIASGQLRPCPDDMCLWGELSLDGAMRPCRGALAVADAARELGFASIVVPLANGPESALVDGIQVKAASTLCQFFRHFYDEEIPTAQSKRPADVEPDYRYDLSGVRGQAEAKRALEIAAAGGHNLLLSGPPGSGKTFLARCLTGILPRLSFAESIEVTKIHSVVGMLGDQPLIINRPFRNPHHTSSQAALIGGGSNPRPGEISLAHRGVLFLDEFTEFTPQVLEALRQPLEDRVVNISRASGSITFPADCMLIAAMNPCKCGYFGDSIKPCVCGELERARYNKKVSGPILDRIDLQLSLRRVTREELTTAPHGEASRVVRERVQQARDLQLARYKEQGIAVFCNADCITTDEHIFLLAGQAKAFLADAITRLGLTARSYYRVIRVARTIADLEPSPEVKQHHIAEALRYRSDSFTLA